MIRFAWRGLSSRRASTILAGLGLLTATVGFVILAGTSRTTTAVVLGDISRAWDTPYDLLVRPIGSATALELSDGLVRPNFLNGTTGGISVANLDTIRTIAGVELAAPIAVVGFVTWPAGIPLDLHEDVSSSGLTVLRVTSTAIGERGLSTFPSETAGYLVYAPDGRVTVGRNGPPTLETGAGTLTCESSPPLFCFGGLTPEAQSVRGLAPGVPGVFIPFDQPILIAGIDPAAERELLGIDRCLTAGRYLNELDNPRVENGQPLIPVLVSRESFLDETLRLEVARSTDGDRLLATGDPEALAGWEPLETRQAAAEEAWSAFLPTLTEGSFYDPSPIWSIGDVTFRQVAPNHLAAQVREADPSIYETAVVAMRVPPEAGDVWFRPVERHDQERRSEIFSRWDPVGQYDPACIPGFDPLAGGRLETYALPRVSLPTGGTLGPTRSPGSYVAGPPLILTTLGGAEWFADPTRYEGRPGDSFISAIRVRVTGTGTPSAIAEARLARVAAAIRADTGLEVDIVKGSSPRTIKVDLPAGRFGRPPLTVLEGWSVKGVAVQFVQAVSTQDLFMFVLILVSAGLLVAETAFLSIRERRTEFAILRGLGWPRSRIVLLVELELLVLGSAVGLLALVPGLLIATISGIDVSAGRILLAVPMAILVALVGGLVPALIAGRGSVVRALTPASHPRSSHGFRSVGTLGLLEVVRSRRVEAFIGAIAVAIGGTLLGGVVLLASGFAGQLDATVLGTYLAFRVQPFHVIVAILALVVGTMAAGVIVLIGYLERQRELAALRALGWPSRSVAVLVAGNAAVVGFLGSGLSAISVMALSLILGAPAAATWTAIASAVLAALIATLVALVGPLVQVYRQSPSLALRGE